MACEFRKYGCFHLNLGMQNASTTYVLFPDKSKYSYGRADLSITAKITTEWDGLVLVGSFQEQIQPICLTYLCWALDRAELVQEWVPSQFATPTFFHTVSGMDRYASDKKGLWSYWKQTVDCICTFVLWSCFLSIKRVETIQCTYLKDIWEARQRN